MTRQPGPGFRDRDSGCLRGKATPVLNAMKMFRSPGLVGFDELEPYELAANAALARLGESPSISGYSLAVASAAALASKLPVETRERAFQVAVMHAADDIVPICMNLVDDPDLDMSAFGALQNTNYELAIWAAKDLMARRDDRDAIALTVLRNLEPHVVEELSQRSLRRPNTNAADVAAALLVEIREFGVEVRPGGIRVPFTQALETKAILLRSVLGGVNNSVTTISLDRFREQEQQPRLITAIAAVLLSVKLIGDACDSASALLEEQFGPFEQA